MVRSMTRRRVWSYGVAGLVVVACIIVAARAGAEPKAYLAPLLSFSLIGVGIRWFRDRRTGLLIAWIGTAVCVAAVAAHWSFPLSASRTAQLLRQLRPIDPGPVRCVTPPKPGGYPEFGSLLFGRIYVCGAQRTGAWNKQGGVRIGQGVGVEVDDTHIVRLYP
jgi:hypothetical protein